MIPAEHQPARTVPDGETRGETRTAGHPAPVEIAGDRIGRYKLLQVLGQGGFGVVYLAEQEEPVRRKVALKVIKLGMDTAQVIARFEAERQALALMDHPNIAKVLDAGQTETGRPFFVMELVRGIPITEYCNKERLPPPARLELFVQVCQAIQHAHQKGIIHRDVKPSNVLVAFQDGMPVPKVIDFGIAKATSGRLTDKTLFTLVEQFIGTPAYMSPEQAEMSNIDIDTRCDIYSLGVLLYELLTGATPFAPKKIAQAGFDEMRRRIREDEPPRPSTALGKLSHEELATAASRFQTDPARLISAVRGDLDWVIMKCLEKDRTRRYETANGLAMDIKRFLGQEPVLARPPSHRYRVQKLIQRNKALVAAAAAIVLALVGGLGAAVFGLARAQQENQRAVAAAQSEAGERLRAQSAEAAAKTAAELAGRSAEESRGRLVRSQVSNGLRLLEANDSFGALAWFTAAFAADEKNDRAQELHRRRIAGVLRHAPSLRQMWFHEAAISQAQFNHDASRVVAASRDGKAYLWSTVTGEPICRPMEHNGPVETISFHPRGTRVLTASMDGFARLWSPEGRPIGQAMPHQGQVKSAAFDQEGARVITASDDGTARVWSGEDGSPLSDSLPHGGIVWHANFSPSGEEAATASETGGALIWDLRTGRPKFPPLRHGGPIRRVLYSPDGTRLATVSIDGSARLWNATTAEPLGTLMNHGGGVEYGVFSPSGDLFATASHDMTARVWDGISGGAISPPLRHGHGACVAAFAPDGRTLVTGSWDGAARIWSTADGTEELVLRHLEQVAHVAFSRDGSLVLTAGKDGIVQLWDLSFDKRLRLEVPASEGETLRRFSIDPSSPDSNLGASRPFETLSAAFSPDGSRFLTASEDGAGRIWRTEDGAPVTPVLRHDGMMLAAAFASGGRRVATGSADGTARIWDADTGAPLTPPLAQDGWVLSVAFSPDGRLLATAGADGTAIVRDGTSGVPSGRVSHRGAIRRVVFSPDGSRFATASFDGTARVWSVPACVPLTEPLQHSAQVWDVNFSPDGEKIITACADSSDASCEARIWSARTGQPVSPPLRHADGIFAASFNPAGTRVLTASEDSTARVWLPDTGDLLAILPARYHVNFAAFSPDGLLAATASGDGFVRVWDAETGEAVGPPLGPRAPMKHLQFSPDGRKLLSAASDGRAYLWELPIEDRSLSNLVLLAEVLGKQRLGESGGMEPLPVQALRERWAKLANRALTYAYPAPVEISFAREKIPTRDPDAAPALLDLSEIYNAPLEESWHGNAGNDLAELLPAGIKHLAGTAFDVRGIVQLRCGVLPVETWPRFPERIDRIEVGQPCARIHFLHGTGWGNGAEGTLAATYLIHYADGHHSELPVRLGDDLRDWHFDPNERLRTKNSVVAWEGSNLESRNGARRLQLFKSTWQNPAPGKNVDHIEIVSAMNEPGIFVLGITIDR